MSIKELVRIGDMIKFGLYEWRVLEVRDGQALLLTDKIITSSRSARAAFAPLCG